MISLIIALQKRASCQFVAFVRFQYPHLVAHLRKNVLFCSKASKVEQALVIGLGAFNLVGVVVLSGMLRWEHHVLQTALIFFVSCMVVLCKSPKGTKGCCKNNNGSAENEQRNTTVGFSEWLLSCGRGLEFCWVQRFELWKKDLTNWRSLIVWATYNFCLFQRLFIGSTIARKWAYSFCNQDPTPLAGTCLIACWNSKFFYFVCFPLHKTLNPILD